MKFKYSVPATTAHAMAARFVRLSCSVWLVFSGAALHAATPTNAVVEMRFPEGTNGYGGNGITSTNEGAMGGNGLFVQPDDAPWEGPSSTNIYPVFTTNVPTGTYVPPNNNYALNMGTGLGNSLGGSHGRAVDVTTDTGPFGGSLGAMPKLTICGWLNANAIVGLTGGGGNRIASALETPGGLGFELVHNAQGQLVLGVNQYNNGVTASSVGVVTADANTGSNNWVYFAVTYDPTLASDQAKFYVGKSYKLAALDVARTYTPPAGVNIDFTGILTIGNFGPLDGARESVGGNNNRVFKGLIDEIRIYTNALSVDEVQQAQLNGTVPSTPASFLKQPVNTTITAGGTAVFTADANGSGTVTYQWRTNGVAVPGATGPIFTWTDVAQAYNGTLVSVLIDNVPLADPGLASVNVTLSVLPNDPFLASVSFSEGAGNTATNLGAMAGWGRFRIATGFPLDISTNVPTGPFAPSAIYNVFSLHNGLNGGNRAVDLTNSVVSPIGALGSMNGLTICGWLNSANNSFRTTSTGRGTAVVNASLGGTLGGFALGYRDNAFSSAATAWGLNSNGRLVLHVNEWKADPVASIASSADTVPINTNLPVANWVFFAVTYDGFSTVNNMTYYFGNANQEATNDVTVTYNKGTIPFTGSLAIGNHNSTGDGATATAGNPTGRTVSGDNGTAWRGLMDEIKIFSKVLTLAEIRQQQVLPALPTLLVYSNTGPNLELSWETTTSFPYQLQSRTDLNTGSWANVPNAESVSGNIHRVTVGRTNQTEFFRIKRP